MNQKEIEKQKRELLHQILDLVLDINGLEERKQELTGNKPTMFFSFLGHTCQLSINVKEDGWEPHKGRGIHMMECVDSCSCEDLKVMIRKLEAIKAETPAAGTAGESK